MLYVLIKIILVWITHILERFNINPYGEEAAYLTGCIGQLMFPKAKRFLCKCHCK